MDVVWSGIVQMSSVCGRGFLKEILELHKRGGLGDEVPQKLKHIVVYCNKF